MIVLKDVGFILGLKKKLNKINLLLEKIMEKIYYYFKNSKEGINLDATDNFYFAENGQLVFVFLDHKVMIIDQSDIDDFKKYFNIK